MSDLRSKLIRLAKENPELRGDLLPLLGKEATSEFDLEAYKKHLLKEAGNFVKMNGKQKELWKEAYTAVLTLYNVTFDKEQKKRIEDIMSDMKSNALSFLNQEFKDLTSDIRLITLLNIEDVEITRASVKKFKSKRVRNAAMYYLRGF